jgi:8-oxo-dGTP diphosphatase
MTNASCDGTEMILTVVAAALFDPQGRVLVQRRPAGKQHAGLWEFPGGKVDPGERPEAALARELMEELGIAVDHGALVPVTFASEPIGERHLVLLLYRCAAWAGEPVALDAAEIRWMAIDDLHTLDMPPADRPFIAALAAQR